jgi:ribosome-associated translation inhibitor RaiA
METPLRISFPGGDSSEALTRSITDHVEALEKLHGRMTACHVVVQVPDRHGGPFGVHIHMSLPGGIDINVDHTPQANKGVFDPQFAANDAFRRAKRLLKDRASRRRGEVKTLHERIERTLDEPDA